MIKYYCDVCGKELIRHTFCNRITKQLDTVRIEIMVALKNVWNAGHICEDCVLEVVKKGKYVEG